MERIVSEERERALVALLDDESPVVQRHLLLELKRLEDIGLSLLRNVIREGPPPAVTSAKNLLGQLEGPDRAAEFVAFIRSLRYELETGMLLLNRVIKPDLDVGPIQRQLDRIAGRCEELMPKPGLPFEQCKVLNRVIFHEYGFRGNMEDYEDPLNSFLGAVLRRRKGIPISLTVLYLLISQRCGLELEAISLPHRVMVGCFREGAPFYIDTFERGRFRSLEEIHTFMEANHIPDPHRYVAPATVAEILCRSCRVLSRHYALKNNRRMALVFAGFVREFDSAYRRHARP